MYNYLTDIKDIISILVSPVLSILMFILSNRYKDRSIDKVLQRKDELKSEDIKLKKIKLYSKIIEIDGEKNIFEVLPCIFNIDVYFKSIRQLLYKKYYLLDREIKSIVIEIDKRIRNCKIREEISEEDHETFVKLYSDLIKAVNSAIDKYMDNELYNAKQE